MSRLVLVRHGQSLWNLEDRFTGRIDIPLTDADRAATRRSARFVGDMRFAFTDLLVVVDGNSLRVIAMQLDGLTPEAILGLEMEMAVPIVYEIAVDKTIRGKEVGDS